MRRQPYIKIHMGPIWSPGQNSAVADLIPAVARGPCRVARAPAIEHVRAKKHTPIYRAHSYHTKVPPQGIEPFIRHFAPAGGLVLDPFCGSGMTGVAAWRAGRRAILSDLSPAATFIAANCCTSVDRDAFLAEAQRIGREADEQLGSTYRTACGTCRRDARILMTVFSARYRCPHCRQVYVLWDVARGERDIELAYRCPGCGRQLRKDYELLVDWRPVRIKYHCPACGRGEKPPSRADARFIEQIEASPLPDRLWCPTDPIPAESDEIGRVLRSGITTVADLFTARNRFALALLWKQIGGVRDAAIRARLVFAFTGTLPRASRTNKYIPSLGAAPGPLLGTMYIPGFYPEVNVLDLFGRKVADVAGAMAGMPPIGEAPVRVSTQSATDLSNIPDGSVDYVFTDPPFGGNIQYSELNLPWESWLGHRTDAAREAVISRSQGKSAADYAELMRQAFSEMHRVLRRGGWLTLLFHNASSKVWAGLQQALAGASFEIRSIGTFDKAHDTFKQVTATGAVGYDVLVHARRGMRCSRRIPGVLPEDSTKARLADFLRGRLAGVPFPRGTAQLRKLHAEALGHFMQRGFPVDFGYAQFRETVRKLGS